jgi:outer membrane protein TolC
MALRARLSGVRLIGVALAGWLVASSASADPIRLTPHEAVQRALKLNLTLKADRLDPALTDAAERGASASFEPLLFGSTDVSGSPGSVSVDRAGLAPTSTTSVTADVGARKLFSVGTSVEGSLSTSALFGGGRNGLNPAYESNLALSARQALLRGISRTANLAAVVTARLGREAANAGLERQAELLAADTLRAYWDLRAASAKVTIQKVALQTTELTLRETKDLIAAGKLPASEEASSAYAVKRQLRANVAADQELQNARDRMARLIGLVPPGSLATPEIVPVSSPRHERPKVTLPDLQRQALSGRADYRSLQLAAKAAGVDEHAARHQLLPKLDLVAALQLTGLSGTGLPDQYPQGYWRSYGMDRIGWSAGLVLEVPLGNQAAKSRRDIAALKAQRAKVALELAEQTLSLELNITWRAVQVNREQLRVSEEAARVAETKLANETARYKAGKTTAHILSDIQAEVVTERMNREQALADLVKSVVDLQAASGGLLQRLGLRPDGEVRR